MAKIVGHESTKTGGTLLIDGVLYEPLTLLDFTMGRLDQIFGLLRQRIIRRSDGSTIAFDKAEIERIVSDRAQIFHDMSVVAEGLISSSDLLDRYRDIVSAYQALESDSMISPSKH
jgi:Rps23 Pro-64 3,4-dihydroxylase Tpa1-like proline 4-hydroxylase